MGKDGLITKITKRPRETPLKDIPIAFPPFENLHLELMENKRKLAPNLPLIPPKRIKPPPSPPKEKEEEHNPIQSEIKTSSKKDKKKKKKKKKHHPSSAGEDENDDSVEEIMIPIAVSEEEASTKEEEEEEEEDGMSDVKESSSSESSSKEEKEEDDEDDPYAGLSPEERLAKEREEYIWRFRILKRKYKNSEIPSFNEHSDLQVMKTTYDRTIRELYLDDAVDNYRTYLKGGFILIEHLCTQWMDIDMTGFASQQFKLMHKYDRLIIELGEKSYSTWGTNLPVELRLIGLVLFNAAVFYLGKIIAEKYGESTADFFMSFTGQPPQPEKQPVQQNQPKMRGPRFRAEDLDS